MAAGVAVGFALNVSSECVRSACGEQLRACAPLPRLDRELCTGRRVNGAAGSACCF